MAYAENGIVYLEESDAPVVLAAVRAAKEIGLIGKRVGKRPDSTSADTPRRAAVLGNPVRTSVPTHRLSGRLPTR